MDQIDIERTLDKELEQLYLADEPKAIATPMTLALKMVGHVPVTKTSLVISDIALAWALIIQKQRFGQKEIQNIRIIVHTAVQLEYCKQFGFTEVAEFDNQNAVCQVLLVEYNDLSTWIEKQLKAMKKIKSSKTRLDFGVILGNPPYQESSDKKGQGSLWPKFVKWSTLALEKGGYLAFVTPSAWMAGGAQAPACFTENQILVLDPDCHERYFPKVASTFCWYIIQNSPVTSKTQIVGNETFEADLRSLKSLPIPFTKETIELVEKIAKIESFKIKFGALKPADGYQKDKATVSKTKTETHIHPVFHTNAQTLFTAVAPPELGMLKVIWTLSGHFKPFFDDGKLGATDLAQYIIVQNKAEAEALISFLMSKPIQYFVSNICKYSGFISYVVTNRLPKVDLTRTWDDDAVYELLELSQEAIQKIKNEA